MKNYQKNIFGSLLCLFASFIWGLAFPAQRAADAAGMPPITLTSLRFFVGAGFLFLLLFLYGLSGRAARPLLSRRAGKLCLDISRAEWLGGFFCGMAIVTASAFQQFGLTLNQSAGKTAFITALYVALVPVLGFFIKRRTHIVVFLGTLGAIVGAFLLAGDFSAGFSIGVGDLLVLVCAVIYAVHILLIDHFSPSCDGVRLSFVQFLTAGILASPALLFEDLSAMTPAAILPLLYIGIMSSGVAYTLQIVAQKNTHPAVASAVLSLESVFGVLGGALIFSETLSLQEGIGCAILFVSVLVAELGGIFFQKKKNGETAPEYTEKETVS